MSASAQGAETLGFGRHFRARRTADLRALGAQLELSAAAIRDKRLVGIGWAALIAIAASRAFGFVGDVPLVEALLLPLLVGAATFAGYALVADYKALSSAHSTHDAIRPWFQRLLVAQAVISGVWGLQAWILWDPASAINHVFLAGTTATVLAALILPSATQTEMFVASLAPVAIIASARFVLGGTSLDYCLGAVVPIFAAQLFFEGGRLVKRVNEDSLLRFQVEDLARELEATRDEALRKRFEAETANASKTAFLANMSHELRTPLNAILGFSEIISQECFGPVGSQRYKEYAGDIHSSGSHLLSLINDLLDVAKIEAGKMEIAPHPLDAKRVFDIALKLIAVKAREKKQTLTVEIDPACPPLYADERAVKQMLINLVSNAVKFTPESGRIAVRAQRTRDGAFLISVRDNGPGIPREKMDKIFTPFGRVDNRYDRSSGGTGLGLALVRGLAELHGGRTWMESEVGRGSCAYVLLPSELPAQIAALAATNA